MHADLSYWIGLLTFLIVQGADGEAEVVVDAACADIVAVDELQRVPVVVLWVAVSAFDVDCLHGVGGDDRHAVGLVHDERVGRHE